MAAVSPKDWLPMHGIKLEPDASIVKRPGLDQRFKQQIILY